jgi:hypothetical protein
MYCKERPAVWPDEALVKMFCTVKCAALYGAERGAEKLYCRKHERWYYFDEECDECAEERAAKKSKTKT